MENTSNSEESKAEEPSMPAAADSSVVSEHRSSEDDNVSPNLQEHGADVEGCVSSLENSINDQTNDPEEHKAANSASSLDHQGQSFNEDANEKKVNGTEDMFYTTIVANLKKQNEFLLAQLQESRQSKSDREYHQQADGNCTEEIVDLKHRLQQSIMARSVSEELASELHAAVLSAEQRAEEAEKEFAKVQKELEEEVKARDKKYSELDVKFGKLQKRAKQRIQEMQKEKEDIEAQLAAALEKASQASSQCTSLQHDLERVRAQAGDALRSLDAERQQLRSTNSKQKEVIEDLQHRLEAKEQEHREAEHVATEKEQVVNELTDKLMEMEKNHDAVVADLASKHQQVVADFETQLADAVQERKKLAESVASLQMQLAKKESHIAELDAVSSGEAIRLTASLDSARAELARMEQEHV